MTRTDALSVLARWRAEGWIRALDLAFPRFVAEMDPEAPGSLLIAAAILSNVEGRGHSCLPLAVLLDDPDDALDWPAQAKSELTPLLAQMPLQGGAASEAWQGISAIEISPTGHDGCSPMVLHDGNLYLRRYWRCESVIAAQVRARTSATEAHALPAAQAQQAREVLDLLFGAPTSPTPSEAPRTHWQKVSCALALRGGFTIITGGPGTGKTYTAARLLVLLQVAHQGPQPLRVALAAPTGKAAARLKQSIETALQDLRTQLGDALPLDALSSGPMEALTLHSLLGARTDSRRFKHDENNPLDIDILFADETSMVHVEMMASLLSALPAKARVILLGDKDQLSSVEAGSVLADLCHGSSGIEQQHPYDAGTRDWLAGVTGEYLAPCAVDAGSPIAQQTATLRESRRFSGPIGQIALAVNRGSVTDALALLRAPSGPISLVLTPEPSVVSILAQGSAPAAAAGPHGGDMAGYRSYLECVAARPGDPEAFRAWAVTVLGLFDRFRVLCAVREGPWGVSGLNTAIERSLAARGLIQRRSDWYEGRPVRVTRNNPALGVFNGDIGLVLRPPGAGQLRAYFFDGSELRSVSVARLADVQTAYAMTMHNSQGSEFGHVVLVLPDVDSPVLTRELLFTGITRSRERLSVVATDTQKVATAIRRSTTRFSGLRGLLHAPGRSS